MNTLLTLAEVAITMAGFSAVVVIFKKPDTNTWLKLDADGRVAGRGSLCDVSLDSCLTDTTVVPFGMDDT